MLTELTAWPWSVFVAIVLAIYDNHCGRRAPEAYPQVLEPIRRYDLYCRWLQNVVSLMNHHEFMAMLIGLTLSVVLGFLMDPAHSVLAYKRPGVQIVTDVILVLHWIYSLVSLFLEGEIFIILVGLISRNETVETAQEWKQNKHDVARETSKGNNIHVESLPDSDDYNELLDNGEFVHSQRQTPLTKAARRTVSTSGVSHDGTAKQRGTSEPGICASGMNLTPRCKGLRPAILDSVFRFADRDEMGLKPLSDSTPKAAAEMKKYVGLLLVYVPILSQILAWPTYFVAGRYLGQQDMYDAKFHFIYEYQLGYVFLAVWLVGMTRTTITILANGARAPARVNRPDQHVYKIMANSGPLKDAPYVLMANTGAVGRFNRAQRSMYNTDESLPMYLMCTMLAASVFGPIVLLPLLLTAYGRITFARLYIESLTARGAGFLPSMIGEKWTEGLVLLCAIKGIFFKPAKTQEVSSRKSSADKDIVPEEDKNALRRMHFESLVNFVAFNRKDPQRVFLPAGAPHRFCGTRGLN
ncbi:unnamed protein product [Symbiodinium necroappetens]|uniref:Palmitoyltransferase n=1 Tax=Symbiodinium necroappetens TaxID=1628268 RepID=A0A812Y2J3_9DINO|nr:unnamed protein product [Symbiodinium necroappetens]